MVILFPGQGVQRVGMGKDFYDASKAARDIFERAEKAVDFPILKLILEGPEEELTRTSYTQPCVYTVSCAIYEALKEKHPGVSFSFGAGHSLGEYNALYAAGAFSFEDGLYLVSQRGRLMEDACPYGIGGMAAVIGLGREVVEEVCSELSEGDKVISPANYNSKSQIVVSGHIELVKKAVEVFREKGAKKVVELKVGGPFHSKYMEPAAEAFKEVVEKVEFKKLTFPVISNVDAKPHVEPEEIKELLCLQIKSPVRWVETIEYLVDSGIRAGLEVGPGSVIMGLVRGITRDLKIKAVTKVGDIGKVEVDG